MGSNILIVESKNDKFFFQAVVDHLNCNIEIAPPILISDEDYRSMEGLDSSKLKQAFKDLKADIQKGEIERVGIIIDIDNYAIKDRLELLNECIQEVFPTSPPLETTNEFIELNFDSFDIQLACYFNNIDGQGELETLLKKIKNKVSIYADCLESWQACLQSYDKKITTKEFNKFWVSMYLRFDTCSAVEKRQAERKCSMKGFDYVMQYKPEIWNLDHPDLNNLKNFFKLFC